MPRLALVFFTCPRCSRTSQHPADAREGYCAACGMFTGSVSRGMWQFIDSGPEPVGQVQVDLAATVRYIGEKYGLADMVALTPLEGLTVEVSGLADPNVVSRLITGWSQSAALIQTDSAERQREVDDCPWDDAFSWSAGYRELE